MSGVGFRVQACCQHTDRRPRTPFPHQRSGVHCLPCFFQPCTEQGPLLCPATLSLTSPPSFSPYPSLPPKQPAALRRHLKRFTEEMRMSAAEEVNSLVVNSLTAADTPARGAAAGGSSSSSSALAGLPIQVSVDTRMRVVRLNGLCAG